MTTKTREARCITCDIGAFCRNHYYRGKLLTERDFLEEQRYSSDKARLHTVALHGWGILCGFKVRPHEYCPNLRFVVEPGFGIDCCGREVRLTNPVEILLPPAPPPKPDHNDCPDDTPPEDEDDAATSGGEDAKDSNDEKGGYGDVAENNLYICIRYSEWETEFAPAPFDDCNCNADGQQPNRICEGAKVEIYQTKPDFWDKAVDACDGCKSDDCWKLYDEAMAHCHAACKVPCLPLAVIRNYEPGKPVDEKQIDNGPRRQLVSTTTLDRLIQCILHKLPARELTHILDTNWEHGSRLLCHHFIADYVGTEKFPKGFEIRFDKKVYSDAIDTRSFQAMVVYRPDNLSEPRHMEIAPARVEKDPHETDWCRLHIDHNYAQRLNGKNFDLYLSLRCNVISDKNGFAVDGNFLASQDSDSSYGMVFPTGDNIAGGTFESWIRVRPRAKGA